MAIPDKNDIYLYLPMYKETEFTEEDLEDVKEVLNPDDILDCYCVDCQKESTFTSVVTKDPYPFNQIGGTNDPFGKRNGEFFNELLERVPIQKTIKYTCARENGHILLFTILISGHVLLKVGQYPSAATIESHSLKKYRKILSKDRYAELSRGIGLSAHGVGIGSFVYLRRTFEYLINEANEQAHSEDDSWSIEEFKTKRMDDKIKALENYLPAFLVENRSVYGILSQGVHELSEQECLDIFPDVRIAIELILDEKIYQDEQKKKIKSTSGKLGKIATRLLTK